MRKAGASLTWGQVSLYAVPFPEAMGDAALEGTRVREGETGSLSPEFTTDGRCARCWRREKESIWLGKAGSALYGMGPLSECLAAQISGQLCPMIWLSITAH